MGKTYRRDSDRKLNKFQRGKVKPNKIKNDSDKPKHNKPLIPYSDDTENEY